MRLSVQTLKYFCASAAICAAFFSAPAAFALEELNPTLADDASVTSNESITINADADNNASGTLVLQSGGANALTVDGNADVTINNNLNTNGINNNNQGITNAGSVSGVSNLGANSASIATTLDVDGATTTDGITNDGNIATTTLNVSGASTTNGINNNNQGITNAGAISGASTIDTSGQATLNSASITNSATIGGNLGISGNLNATGIDNANQGITGAGAISDVTTITTSGQAALNSASITNNATVGGNLGVTGDTTLSTLSTSGLATLDSASVTNDASVGGNFGVAGTTTTNGITNTGNVGTGTLSTSGLATLDSASITNDTTIGGTLGVTGNTTLSTVSTSGLATFNSASITNNANVGGTLDVTGDTTLSTLSTSGLATLDSAQITNNASVGGDFDVTGATTLDSTLDVAGAVTAIGGMAVSGGDTSLTSADSNSTMLLGNAGLNLNRTSGGPDSSNITLNDSQISMQRTASATENSNITLDDNEIILSKTNGADTNSITVGDTTTTTINGNSVTYGTRVEGGMLVNGDFGVNGNIYSLDTTANSGINVGNNGLDINGATNTTSLVADGNASSADGRAEVALTETTANMRVFNQTTGEAHGLSINQTQTVLTGGTSTTSLTLDDSGATFADEPSGGPARVTGIADGFNDFDAVNYKQLREGLEKAYSGIAAVSALTSIPQPAPGQRFTVGVGYGHYEDQNAMAFGGQARLTRNFTLRGGMGLSSGNTAISAGIGYSW